jgi:hypothetical protein
MGFILNQANSDSDRITQIMQSKQKKSSQQII